MFTNLRNILALLFICCAQVVVAQSISVSSFKLLETDLTANTTGTMERDQNGEVAALIKVVTTEQGFVFDGGMTGVVKTKQGVGEVWVYVPHGIKRITIQHPQLGVLRDYYFPIAIEKARTYELVLAMGKVETYVNRTASKQYVTFTVNPSNAMVELDGMPLDVDSDGYAEKVMPYGTYSYRVSCANYHTEAGQVAVTAQGKAEVAVTLRLNFGWIEFSGADELYGADIYVDNERIGQLPMRSGELKSGAHQIKVLKPLYKPWEQQVTVTWGDTTQVVVKLSRSREAVDLGLSVKWANCNVGAKSPEEYGDYFAWGETKTKSKYTKYNSVICDLSISELKSRGIIGSDGNLTVAYDAATANWGGGWRMPTLDEMKELCNNCSWSWTTQNGVNGYMITGPNGNSIFLPDAANRNGAGGYSRGSSVDYWSGTLYEYNSRYAYGLDFNGGRWNWSYDSCYDGHTVRPVSEK